MNDELDRILKGLSKAMENRCRKYFHISEDTPLTEKEVDELHVIMHVDHLQGKRIGVVRVATNTDKMKVFLDVHQKLHDKLP